VESTQGRKAIIVDLDGTLAIIGDRGPYDGALCQVDAVNPVVRDIAIAWRTMNSPDGDILLVSGRQEMHRPQTERWLNLNNIPYAALLMRETGDPRRDAIVKRELFERHIRGTWTIDFVLDDRTQVVKMWRRDLNLICLQVADGDF